MFDERHLLFYYLAFGTLIMLKIGLLDTIREYLYDRKRVKIEGRKYIFFAETGQLLFKEYLDIYQARKIQLFTYLVSLGFCIFSLFLIKNLP